MISFYEIIFIAKSYHAQALKAILFLILLMYLISFIKSSIGNSGKKDFNDNQIDEIKYFNHLYKDKIKKLENELNSLKYLNLEFSNLIDKTLLIENKEFKRNLINKIKKVYTKNNVVNINEVESSIKGGRKCIVIFSRVIP